MRSAFSFVEKYGEFRVAEFSVGFKIRGIHEDGACVFHGVEGVFHQLIYGVAESAIFAIHADARALQAIGIEEFGVVGGGFACALGGRGVARINAESALSKVARRIQFAPWGQRCPGCGRWG